MNVIIIDYGMGNLHSVVSGLKALNVETNITSSSEDISNASHIILPGVGSFSEGIKNLKESKLDVAINDAIKSREASLLGICLGMQLLAERGTEGSECSGLGLIRGEVKKFKQHESGERIPHMGWNEVKHHNNLLFNGIPSGNDFYFLHSYYFNPTFERNIVSTTSYLGNFASAINDEQVWGVQFHPEKSSKYGLKLLENFLNT